MKLEALIKVARELEEEAVNQKNKKTSPAKINNFLGILAFVKYNNPARNACSRVAYRSIYYL